MIQFAVHDDVDDDHHDDNDHDHDYNDDGLCGIDDGGFLFNPNTREGWDMINLFEFAKSSEILLLIYPTLSFPGMCSFYIFLGRTNIKFMNSGH